MKNLFTSILLFMSVYLVGQINVNFTIYDASCFDSCDGIISANATGGIPPYTYLWNNGQTTDDIYNLCAGIYTVTVTDSVSNIITDIALISEPDSIQIVIDVTEDTIQAGESDTITILAIGGNGTQYTCYINAVVFNINDSYVVYPVYTTTYCAYCSDSLGCLSGSECVTIVVDSLSGIENKFNKKIDHICYPNPTTNKVFVEITDSQIMDYGLEVFDIYGKEVFVNRSLSLSKCEIDLSQQPKGIYIIKVRTSKGVAVQKVVKN